jgi:hypothetical protein
MQGIYGASAACSIFLEQVTFSANTPGEVLFELAHHQCADGLVLLPFIVDPYAGSTFTTHCRGGFFENKTSKSCEQCLVGKFKDAADLVATSCSKCPEV